MSLTSTWGSLAATLSDQQQEKTVTDAVERMRGVAGEVLRDRARLRVEARQAVLRSLQANGWTAGEALLAALTNAVVSRVSGLGFLDAYLDPEKYSEVVLNPDGRIFVQPRDAEYMQAVDYRPSVAEAMRLAEALAGMAGTQLSVANPTVNARIVREEGFGGARVKILHPVLVVGKDYPAISVRLFFPRLITPEDLIAWEVAPEGVIRGLVELVGRKARVLVIGGTNMGKTTMISALCQGIPQDARIVKIEDPEEIWLEHPNVVTIEPFRPSWAERDKAATYAIADAVADAMRMRPDWLIVGEIRRGRDAMNFMRAQLSGHPGLTSIHAYGPDEAMDTIQTLIYNELGVGKSGTKPTIALATDLMLYLDKRDGKRRLMGVWEVERKLRGGDVRLRPLYEYGSGATQLAPMEHRLMGD